MTETLKEQQNLDAAMMDYGADKYKLVVVGAMWAKHMRRQEEFRHAPHAAVIRAALGQILSGQVTEEQVMAAVAADAGQQAAAAQADAVPAVPRFDIAEEKPAKKKAKKEASAE